MQSQGLKFQFILSPHVMRTIFIKEQLRETASVAQDIKLLYYVGAERIGENTKPVCV